MLENTLHNEDRIDNEYLCIKSHGSNIHKEEIREDITRNRNTLSGNFQFYSLLLRLMSNNKKK